MPPQRRAFMRRGRKFAEGPDRRVVMGSSSDSRRILPEVVEMRRLWLISEEGRREWTEARASLVVVEGERGMLRVLGRLRPGKVVTRRVIFWEGFAVDMVAGGGVNGRTDAAAILGSDSVRPSRVDWVVRMSDVPFQSGDLWSKDWCL